MEYLTLCCCRAAALLAIIATLSAWPVQARRHHHRMGDGKATASTELKPVDVDTKTTRF